MTYSYKDNSVCRDVQTLLSDYVDNTLSARQVWEVEKHLADCADCAETARQLQATVRLLRATERLDTADDFMAKLHARLDGLEPEPAPSRFGLGALFDGLRGLREAVQRHRVPAFGLGISAAALTAVLVFSRSGVTTTDSGPVLPPTLPRLAGQLPNAGDSLKRNVALVASNPFDDPVAANLEAHSELSDAGTPAETE
jgi:anti-sigma factor RsiW